MIKIILQDIDDNDYRVIHESTHTFSHETPWGEVLAQFIRMLPGLGYIINLVGKPISADTISEAIQQYSFDFDDDD